MIETAGGMIPFICHIFLILFGGFFGLSFAFNKNFVKNSIGFESKDAMYMGRPLGFLMIGVVLMLIATLFQIGDFQSANEVIGIMFIFTIIAFCYNIDTFCSINTPFGHFGCIRSISGASRMLEKKGFS